MTYYEKNKLVRLNYQKAYYRENTEKIQKYTKEYYELNKNQMKQKRKGNIPMKRKPKENGMLSVSYKEVILSFD
jgi:phosphotransacetylase